MAKVLEKAALRGKRLSLKTRHDSSEQATTLENSRSRIGWQLFQAKTLVTNPLNRDGAVYAGDWLRTDAHVALTTGQALLHLLMLRGSLFFNVRFGKAV